MVSTRLQRALDLPPVLNNNSYIDEARPKNGLGKQIQVLTNAIGESDAWEFEV